MKRLGKIFLGAAMAVVMSLGTVAPAMSAVVLSPLQVKVNGKTVKFPDVLPYIDSNGRVQVPVRFVSEALGGKNAWDGKTQTVTITKDKRIAKLKIGSNVIDLNGVAIVMDTAAILKNDRTFVPVRYVSEAMGAKVEWIAEKNIVNITLDAPTTEIDRGDYVFPKNTKVLGRIQKDSDYVYFSMFAVVEGNKASNLSQYKDMRDILASQHGDTLADDVYDYIKQKETRNSELPYKKIYLEEIDQWLVISYSPPGDTTVTIDIYKKGVSLDD